MYKKLSSKELLRHPRIRVIEDKIKLPNGEESDYIHIRNPGEGSLIICKDKENRFILIKDYFYLQNTKLITFPSGVLNENESLLDCAYREFEEETGYTVDRLELLGSFYINPRRQLDKTNVFYGTGATIKPIESLAEDPEEDIEVVLMTEDEVTELILDYEHFEKSFLATWALYKANEKFLK